MTPNSTQEMTNEQAGSHLCTSLLEPTEGEPHDWKPDVGTGGIRSDSRIRRSVAEWVFQDEGYSGATLVRPGLEALRDLAAQGQIAAALIYSPGRLSRKYAYQVLLGEEFSRCGVDVIYLKSPSGDSPEDQLVVQFQGMIAEYERAQIAERHRRGKRHRAQQGMVNVLSGAPYGYRYVRKTDTSAAYYEVIESEADVVRMVFATYTQQRFSINAIARLLNERGISTRTGKTRWERSTVWGLLRNPAYEGKACFGKTEQSERQRITRPLRQQNGSSHRSNCHRDRPRADWIEVTVPALVSEETFALAQEQLTKNKHHSPRRTIEPTLLQGMLVCQQCGYALYRSSTRTSQRKLYYYRCLGSDAYRHFKGALCTNRPVRSDYLDQFVWDQIIGLLDNGMLIQAEVDRRKEAARNSDPRRQRSETLRREQTRLGNNVARLITAYQEGLVSLAQLRQRMPELNKQSQAVESELQSLETAAVDQTRYLQLAENLDGFRIKLRERAKTLDVCERQQILRLLVKEVLVAADSLTIRHSIPIPQTAPVPTGPPPKGSYPSGASQGHQVILCVRGVASPLLSNLVLDELDRELERRKHRFVRYADDCNIYVRSQRAGQRVMTNVTRFLTRRLKLKVNEAKSAVARPAERKFLGFSFSHNKEPKRRIALKVLLRCKQKIRELTRRTRGISLEQMLKELTAYLRGWKSYFGFCQTPSLLQRLDQWIRHRLRSMIWKQWKRGTQRYAKLRRLGIGRDLAASTAGSPHGPWRVANTPALSIAFPLAYVDSLGLPRLSAGLA